ncbi:MAG: phage minor head protein, partial [Burkholderiaceae bacterium]
DWKITKIIDIPPEPASEAPAAPEAMKAQHVREAAELLGKVAEQAIASPAAVELLAALGFDRATAQSMVEAQAAPQQKAPDCVGEKVPVLMAEGYPQEQAVAIAISMCEGKGMEAALLGKAVEDIDTVPPQAVQDNARRALEVRAEKPESERGMTAVGIARARDLSNGTALSEDTIRRMVAYFERHASDKSGSTWDEQGKGWQAWQGWGGDEGWAWAKRKVEEFDRARGEKATSAPHAKGCACCTTENKSISARELWTKADTGDLVDDELLKGWLKGVDKVLRQQVRAVVRALKASDGVPSAEMLDKVLGVLRSTRWDRDLVDAMQPYLARSLQHGAELGGKAVAELAKSPAAAQLGWSSAELDRYVERASVRLATRAVDGVNGTTEVQLRDLLGDGMQKGETSRELAARVESWAEGDEEGVTMTRKRALMIARTEAARAASTAEQDAWRSTGLVTGKRWLLAPDPCEFCAAAAKSFGKNGVGLDEPFYAKGDTISAGKAGTMTLDYEDVHGPPLHPHCRCAVQPVLDENFEDIAAEAERRIMGGKAREVKP